LGVHLGAELPHKVLDLLGPVEADAPARLGADAPPHGLGLPGATVGAAGEGAQSLAHLGGSRGGGGVGIRAAVGVGLGVGVGVGARVGVGVGGGPS